MNSAEYANFLQETALVWNWPIAIYLFLLGISVGMVTIAILLKCKLPAHQSANNAVIKATAIVAPISVAIGLLILVFHLTMPWTFWRLMIFYSTSSVMSIGVMLFQIYTLFLILWLAIVFKQGIEQVLAGRLTWINRLIKQVNRFEAPIEIVLLIIAIILGAYTGFLLSALKTYPMLNNPILPVLFLFSGVSSGAAAAVLFAITLFKEPTDSPSIRYIHKLEGPLVWFELFLLAAFFIGLYFGGGQKTVAAETALVGGFWSWVFWLGTIVVGILLPMFLNVFSSNRLKHRKDFILSLAGMSLFGVLMLRLFILYAGQMTMA